MKDHKLETTTVSKPNKGFNMKYAEYRIPQEKYSDQMRLNATFNMEVLEALSVEAIISGYRQASLGHTNMLKNVEEFIKVLRCQVSPDSSCLVMYKLIENTDTQD